MTYPTKAKQTLELALASVPDVRKSELFIFFGQIGYYDLSRIMDAFLNIQNIETEDERLKAFILAGVGKLYLLEGNYLMAKRLIDRARILAARQNRLSAKPGEDEVYAYVLYENGLLFRHLIEPETSMNYFSSVIELSKSEVLRLSAQYQLDTYAAEKALNIRCLIPYLELMKPYPVQHILVLNRIGSILNDAGETRQAVEYIHRGIKMTEKEGLRDLKNVLNNTLGYNYYLRKKYDSALETLNNNVNISHSNYYKVLSTANMALIQCDLGNYSETIRLAIKANKLAKKHHVISEIPDQHRYMGMVYEEKLYRLDSAYEQYLLGYKVAMEQIDWGLSFTGDRNKAVISYVDFLQRHYPLDLNILPENHPFEFMMGKSWKDIKDLFYQQFFQFHLANTTSAEKMCDNLGMKPTTYYSLRARLAKDGVPLPDGRSKDTSYQDAIRIPGLLAWIEKKRDFNRKEIEDAFNRDALAFLYERHGHRKNVLAKALGLSYPTIVNKTKHLYQKGEDNFPT